MSVEAILGEYELVEDTFDAVIPTPNASVAEVKITFKVYKNTRDSEAARKQARELAKNCKLLGDPEAKECAIFGKIKDRLPATSDEAFQIALLSISVVSEPISFIDMIRICSNNSLFDMLWGRFNSGQKTVYAKLVEAHIENAKKNLLEAAGSSLPQSGTSDVRPA